MKTKEALESIMLRAKEGRNKEQQKYIESNYELIKQALDELEELKKQLQGNTLRNRNLILETSNKLLKEDLETKNKLLDLYRECNKEGYFWLEIQQRIKKLEEEMK